MAKSHPHVIKTAVSKGRPSTGPLKCPPPIPTDSQQAQLPGSVATCISVQGEEEGGKEDARLAWVLDPCRPVWLPFYDTLAR